MLESMGKLLKKMGQQEHALRVFRRALSLREGIAALEPDWQAEVENAYWQITGFMRFIGQDQDALETAEQYLLATSFAADGDTSKAERIGRVLGTLCWSALLAKNFPRAVWAGRHGYGYALHGPEGDDPEVENVNLSTYRKKSGSSSLWND